MDIIVQPGGFSLSATVVYTSATSAYTLTITGPTTSATQSFVSSASGTITGIQSSITSADVTLGTAGNGTIKLSYAGGSFTATADNVPVNSQVTIQHAVLTSKTFDGTFAIGNTTVGGSLQYADQSNWTLSANAVASTDGSSASGSISMASGTLSGNLVIVLASQGGTVTISVANNALALTLSTVKLGNSGALISSASLSMSQASGWVGSGTVQFPGGTLIMLGVAYSDSMNWLLNGSSTTGNSSNTATTSKGSIGGNGSPLSISSLSGVIQSVSGTVTGSIAVQGGTGTSSYSGSFTASSGKILAANFKGTNLTLAGITFPSVSFDFLAPSTSAATTSNGTTAAIAPPTDGQSMSDWQTANASNVNCAAPSASGGYVKLSGTMNTSFGTATLTELDVVAGQIKNLEVSGNFTGALQTLNFGYCDNLGGSFSTNSFGTIVKGQNTLGWQGALTVANGVVSLAQITAYYSHVTMISPVLSKTFTLAGTLAYTSTPGNLSTFPNTACNTALNGQIDTSTDSNGRNGNDLSEYNPCGDINFPSTQYKGAFIGSLSAGIRYDMGIDWSHETDRPSLCGGGGRRASFDLELNLTGVMVMNVAAYTDTSGASQAMLVAGAGMGLGLYAHVDMRSGCSPHHSYGRTIYGSVGGNSYVTVGTAKDFSITMNIHAYANTKSDPGPWSFDQSATI